MQNFFVVAFAIVLITGCSPSVPTCSDLNTTALVEIIADREMANQLGAEEAETFTYRVSSIRTTHTNQQTGAYECAAQLEISALDTDLTSEIPITYTVELIDNKDEFYVNVFGL